MRKALSIFLLVLAACALFVGCYGVVSFALGSKPAGTLDVLRVALVPLTGICLAVVGSKLWEGWAAAFAAIMLLVGLAGMQTGPALEQGEPDRLGRRAFQISGAVMVAAGGITYFIARRRRRS